MHQNNYVRISLRLLIRKWIKDDRLSFFQTLRVVELLAVLSFDQLLSRVPHPRVSSYINNGILSIPQTFIYIEWRSDSKQAWINIAPSYVNWGYVDYETKFNLRSEDVQQFDFDTIRLILLNFT